MGGSLACLPSRVSCKIVLRGVDWRPRAAGLGGGTSPWRSGSPDLPGPMMGWLGPPGGPQTGAGPGDPSESASPPRSRPRRRRDPGPPHDREAPGAGRAVDEATPPHVPTLSRVSQGDVTGGRWTPAERWRQSNPKLPSALGLPHRNPTTTTTLRWAEVPPSQVRAHPPAASGRRPVH